MLTEKDDKRIQESIDKVYNRLTMCACALDCVMVAPTENAESVLFGVKESLDSCIGALDNVSYALGNSDVSYIDNERSV